MLCYRHDGQKEGKMTKREELILMLEDQIIELDDKDNDPTEIAKIIARSIVCFTKRNKKGG